MVDQNKPLCRLPSFPAIRNTRMTIVICDCKLQQGVDNQPAHTVEKHRTYFKKKYLSRLEQYSLLAKTNIKLHTIRTVIVKWPAQ